MSEQEHGAPEWHGDGLPGAKIALIGAMSAALTLASTLVAMVIYRIADRNEYETKVIATPYAHSDAVIASQTARLKSYGFADAEKKIPTIPIDKAMSLVEKELIDAQKGANDKEAGEAR